MLCPLDFEQNPSDHHQMTKSTFFFSRCAQAAGLTNMGSGGSAQARQLIEQEADREVQMYIKADS